MLREFISMSDTVLPQIPLGNTNELTKKLPGDLAMWFFILAELTVFAIFFIGFAISEQLNEQMYAQSKQQLHPVAGLINTIALITSSLFVALAVGAIKRDDNKLTTQWLLAANIFAVIYLFVKGWEYQSLFAQGIDIETNTFFTLYFLITLFHFMHVLLGMVILIYMMTKVSSGYYKNNVSGFEAGACYWHMVDMLWIILFPLIYVI